MTEGSLVIMRPGCQQTLKHCVRAERDKNFQVRYCISFRGTCLQESISPLTTPIKQHVMSNSTSSPAPVLPTSSSNTPIIADPMHHTTELRRTKKKICLLAGDSFEARLDPDRLGKGKKDVRRIAEGGLKISDVEDTLEKFSMDNPDVMVEKLFVSIGTNDIRGCRSEVDHLKGPVKKLFATIRILFPDCKVYVQCVLPLPTVHKNVIKNVRGINDILYNCCSHAHFYYMNILNFFLDKWGSKRSSLLFNNRSSSDVHPNVRGMGVLARFYIYHLHSRRFNPIAY